MFGCEDKGGSEETLSIIKELMEQLAGEMKFSKDDFEDRLGRKKPDMVAIKVEGKMPEEGMEKAEEVLGKDLDGDMEMGEDSEHMAKVMGEESPEEKLKKRLLKLRA